MVKRLINVHKSNITPSNGTILGMKFHTILKNFFVLIILHDPLINKLILQFKDQIGK